MPKMLLLDGNIRSLKFELKQAFKEVKSAHLTEGIARGFGFNSNAALRVNVAENQKPKLKLGDFDEAAFFNWLAKLGYSLAEKKLGTIFEGIDDPIWVSSKVDWIRNNWFYNARRNNIPMVHIKPRRKYADVHWDFISVDETHEPKKFTDEDLYRIVELVRKYKGKYGFLGVSVFTGTIYNLKVEDAKIVADEIFSILHNLISSKSWRDAA